jgi:hypothetical protein
MELQRSAGADAMAALADGLGGLAMERPPPLTSASLSSAASPSSVGGSSGGSPHQHARRRQVVVPSLVDLCVDALAARPHVLTGDDLAALGPELSARLLARIIELVRLDYTVARAFLQCGHEGIVSALEGLDLLAGLTALSPHTACRPAR